MKYLTHLLIDYRPVISVFTIVEEDSLQHVALLQI